MRGGQSVGGRDRSEVILLTRRRGITVHHTHRYNTPQGKGGEASTSSLDVYRSPMHVVASIIFYSIIDMLYLCVYFYFLSLSLAKKKKKKVYYYQWV